MAKDDDFIVISDIDSVERMLSNAEIDYESIAKNGTTVTITAENGVVFHFNDKGDLESMDIE